LLIGISDEKKKLQTEYIIERGKRSGQNNYYYQYSDRENDQLFGKCG
jgi:hypothetical protein